MSAGERSLDRDRRGRLLSHPLNRYGRSDGRGMSASDLRGDARGNLCVAINEFQEPSIGERREVVRIIGASQFRKVADGIVPFGSLNKMLGSLEHRAQAAFLVALGGAAGVVEMQMGQDYPIDLVRADANGRKVTREWFSIVQHVAQPMLCRRLAAVTGVDESPRVWRVDENAVRVEQDAMLIVWRRLALPHRAG